MTDPTPDDSKLFEMVPTSDAYMQLAAQVADLAEHVQEIAAGTPAAGDTDDDTTDTAAEITALGARIDRHRSEIENVKRVINQIISFLGSGSGNTIAPSPSADGNTIIPSSTGGL